VVANLSVVDQFSSENINERDSENIRTSDHFENPSASENIVDESYSEENFSREEIATTSKKTLSISFKGGARGNRVSSKTHQNSSHHPQDFDASALAYFSNYMAPDRFKILQQQKQFSSKIINRSASNVGDRMYQQAMVLKQNKERLIAQYQQEAEDKFQ
jgi:hypothetical protein